MTRKLSALALLVASSVALTGCTELSKGEQTLKRHKLIYTVTHDSDSGGYLTITYGHQTTKGQRYQYGADTEKRAWTARKGTGRQRIEYVALDVDSIDELDNIHCKIRLDGKIVSEAYGVGSVSC